MQQIQFFVISCLLTCGIYYGLFKRILSRRHTKDFSKFAQGCIVSAQASNFVLATLEHARLLQFFFAIQFCLASLVLFFIHKYYKAPEPSE